MLKLSLDEIVKATKGKLLLNNNKEVVRKLMVINKALSMLQYNLNINLFIDKLIIDLVGELNE